MLTEEPIEFLRHGCSWNVDWTETKNGIVVNGVLTCLIKIVKKFQLNFGKSRGFNCHFNELESLKNSPQIVEILDVL